jgi:diaminopimelate epimerase
MEIKIEKYHAQGNSYIVIEDLNFEKEKIYSDLSKLLSDKSIGIGSDGILIHNKSSIANARMRVFNPDGSEAEVSGNGLRIFSAYLHSKGIIEEYGEVEVGGKEGGRIAKVRILKDKSIEINLGEANLLGVLEISVSNKKLKGLYISVGNPHFAIECESKDTAKKYLNELGPLIENYPAFPNRVNVEFFYVENKNKIHTFIWERGAGATLSSGTGASASAFAAYKLGKVENEISVEMLGGIIKIRIENDSNIKLAGKVYKIMEGIAFINL